MRKWLWGTGELGPPEQVENPPALPDAASPVDVERLTQAGGRCWEYCRITMGLGSNGEDWIEDTGRRGMLNYRAGFGETWLLNVLGQQGWELVGVESSRRYFKRPRVPPQIDSLR